MSTEKHINDGKNKMPAATLRALRASIAKWRRLATGKRRMGEDTPLGIDTCPLCRLFWADEDGGCRHCPVMQRTGRRSCERTPYKQAEKAANDWGYSSDQFQAAARRELEFLESLLPK
jgi:Zn-finger nucleic acid-binding protein